MWLPLPSLYSPSLCFTIDVHSHLQQRQCNFSRYQNRPYFQALPIWRSRIIMPLLLDHQPLEPIPFHPSIKYQIRAFWKFPYHAYCHLLLRCVFCSSTALQYRFHQFQQYLKRYPEHLSENCFLHRLKHAKYVACEPLFPELLQLLVNPLKTSAKYWTILSGLNAGAICLASIRTHNCCIGPFLFGQSKAFDSHNVNTLIAFLYV